MLENPGLPEFRKSGISALRCYRDTIAIPSRYYGRFYRNVEPMRARISLAYRDMVFRFRGSQTDGGMGSQVRSCCCSISHDKLRQILRTNTRSNNVLVSRIPVGTCDVHVLAPLPPWLREREKCPIDRPGYSLEVFF